MKRLIDANELDDSLGISDRDIEFHYMLEEAETVLTIPENPTNGDVLIALYPNLKYYIRNDRVITTIGIAASFDLKWWNAQWKENNNGNSIL